MAEGQIELWQKKENPAIKVEAIRLNEDNAATVAVWCGGELVEEIDPADSEETQPGINIPTPVGIKRASLSMYVVKFGNQFFTAHNRKFETQYEPVNRDPKPMETSGDTRRRLGFADPFGPPGVVG